MSHVQTFSSDDKLYSAWIVNYVQNISDYEDGMCRAGSPRVISEARRQGFSPGSPISSPPSSV